MKLISKSPSGFLQVFAVSQLLLPQCPNVWSNEGLFGLASADWAGCGQSVENGSVELVNLRLDINVPRSCLKVRKEAFNGCCTDLCTVIPRC